jgi:Uma2 family endonuclease
MLAKNGLDLDQLLDARAVKLEITGGVPTWEASPGLRHQWMVQLIERSIRPSSDTDGECGCISVADVLIRFKDGSLKRPDISIFCTLPPLQDEALSVVPQAVVEVISPGYEYKDVELNPRFYLAQGIDDVLIVDPRSGAVTHYRTAEENTHRAPVTVDLQCGCQCTVPQLEETG